MNYIVLDMEWNFPRSKRQQVYNKFPLVGEIIQIGAVKLNNRLEIIDSFNAIIKPKYYTVMNKEVEKVTQITSDDLNLGVELKTAAMEFKCWCEEGDIILTWGDDDIPMLEDNLEFQGIDFDWIPESYNAQWIFDDQVKMEGRRYSLDYARYTYGIKGRDAHDALNDAYNTAEVLKHLKIADWIAEERVYIEQENILCMS